MHSRRSLRHRAQGGLLGASMSPKSHFAFRERCRWDVRQRPSVAVLMKATSNMAKGKRKGLTQFKAKNFGYTHTASHSRGRENVRRRS